jgi:hypothetical protein
MKEKLKRNRGMREWREAVKAAGFDPDKELMLQERIKRSPKWTQEAIIKELLKIQDKGGVLLPKQLRTRYSYLYYAIARTFGKGSFPNGWKHVQRRLDELKYVPRVNKEKVKKELLAIVNALIKIFSFIK